MVPAAVLAVAFFGPLSAGEKGDGWISLFDGKTLNGWTTLRGDSPKGWIARDGCLHFTASKELRGGQDIYTEKEYSDFILELEWKIAPRGNSGIKYRMNWYEKSYLGPEYQILGETQPKKGKRKDLKGTTGAIYILAGVDPAKQRLKTPGEWNHTRIVASGPRIEHWLNGEKLAGADVSTEEFKKAVAGSKFRKWPHFAQNKSGRIMLQDHGSKVWFRNLRIKVLPASPPEDDKSAEKSGN